MSAGTAAGIVIAALTLGGVLAWLGLLLWAAREDGKTQRRAERALRAAERHDVPRADDP